MQDTRKAADNLGPDEFLCFSVYALGHAFNRLYRPLLGPLGLTYPQYLVMAALWEEDGQTVGQLGEKLLLDSSTLTPLLKRLEAQGRIARTRGLTDERRVKVSLTEDGRALRGEAAVIPGCVLEAAGMSIEELQRMQRELDALRARLMRRGHPEPEQAE